MAKKRGVKFALAVFVVLVVLGLAGVYWFAGPRSGPESEPQVPFPDRPPAAVQALAAHLRQELGEMGVAPALFIKESGDPEKGFDWRVRLPRAMEFDLAKDRMIKAAQIEEGRLIFESREEEKDGIQKSRWEFGYGAKGAVRIEVEKSSCPALAILIDDWGYNTRDFGRFLDLPPQVSLAVFPFESKSGFIAEKAASGGHEVLLHLPLEPHAAMSLVKGTILGRDSDIRVRQLLKDELDAHPQVSGVNNHEGSKGTEDPRIMGLVLEALKQRNLYFLDSRTSARTLASSLALKMGVKQASRKVFLDNEDFIDSIQEAARKAARLARNKGFCIAIGHGRPNTLKVIAELVPEWKQQGIELVPVSELVK